MRAVLYSRVSTLDKGQDPERQAHEMRTFAQARGWSTVEIVDQMSAAKDRPGLRELWRLCRQRRADIVLVHEFSRFARSTKELLLALDEFNALGIQFVSLREQIDTTTPAGKMMYTMIAAMAEFERAMIRERVKSGLRLRQSTLEHNGSFVARSSGKRCFHLGRPRALLPGNVEHIAERRRQGWNWKEIAGELEVSVDTCKRAAARKIDCLRCGAAIAEAAINSGNLCDECYDIERCTR
jgi:DNA invertase Pin-like site-specific DNA recombinase